MQFFILYENILRYCWISVSVNLILECIQNSHCNMVQCSFWSHCFYFHLLIFNRNANIFYGATDYKCYICISYLSQPLNDQIHTHTYAHFQFIPHIEHFIIRFCSDLIFKVNTFDTRWRNHVDRSLTNSIN